MKKIISSIFLVLISAITSAVATERFCSKATKKAQEMSDKHLALFLLMNQWVLVKQEGKNLKDYFNKNGYKTIAIYGMSYAGERLLRELEGSDVTIKYGIDKKADVIYSDIEVISVDEDLEDVDVIVVTPIFFFNEIEEVLSKKIDCPIISLEDILYDV
ncbi:hypothetical protein [Kineothrix sedimenti]|uniref:Flavodoxin-like protein n=1 Tax=Kineothrix sedimenti TaxID=3123317 RepID=A0ABZ3EXC3_9FIRM